MITSCSFPHQRSNSVRPTYVGRYRRALSGIIRAHDCPARHSWSWFTAQSRRCKCHRSNPSIACFFTEGELSRSFWRYRIRFALSLWTGSLFGERVKKLRAGGRERGEFTVNSHYSGHCKDLELERFSYDLELKTREQDRTTNERRYSDVIGLSNGYKRAWLLVGKQTLGWKNFMPKNVLEINRYFALTSYCDTIDQSINAFSILGFSVEPENEESMFWSFHPLADKTNN